MTTFTFPSGFIGTTPTPGRTMSLLSSDGTNTGSVSVANVLGQLNASDISTAGGLTSSTAASTYAPIASPTFTGNPAAPTQGTSDNTTKIATTAYVKAQGYSTIASPTFTGVPAAPTAGAGTNTTQLATTAFVTTAVTPLTHTYKIIETGASAQWVLLGTFTAAQAGDRCTVNIVSGRSYNADATQLQMSQIVFVTSNGSSVDANGFAGSSLWYRQGEMTTAPTAIRWIANAAGVSATSFNLVASFDVFTGNNSYYEVETGLGTWTNVNTGGQSTPGAVSSTICAPLEEFYVSSPVKFLNGVTLDGAISINSPGLIGSPISTTPSTGDNTTRIATTAFVKAQLYATLASPTFTGTVIAPTVTPGTDNTTKVATTAFVQSAITSSGTFNAAAVAITGGSIDGTTLGLSTPSTGAFTSLSATTSIALTAATATTVPVFNGSKQIVSGTLGAGLSLSGTTISFAPANVLVTPTSKSSAYTVAQTDNNATIYTGDASTVAYTFPALTAGTTVEIVQGAAGKITWTAGATVTINCPVGGATGTRAQWSAMRFKYLTSTSVVVNGDVS